MTSTTPPPPAPDEPGTFVLVARLLAVQLLAVVAVAGVIAVVFTIAGRGTGPDTPAAATKATSATAAPTSSAPAAGAPAASPTPATTAPPAPATTSPTATATDRPKVDVLNQSAGSGAAAAVAGQVRSAGWRTGRIADFRGNVASTTIYYPPGLRSQARALARALPGPQRLRSAFSTLSGSRLSIVLVG